MDDTDDPRPRPGAATGVGRHLARQVEQVVVNEKKARQAVVLHQPQLFGEPRLGVGPVYATRGVALVHPSPAQLRQRARRGRAIGAFEVGEAVTQVAREIEGPAALGEGLRSGDSIGTVSEQRSGFGRRAQVKFAVGAAHGVRRVERGAVADRDQHILQAVPIAAVVMHVARRHDAEPRARGEVGERAGAGEVAAHVVALQLDIKPLGAEHRAAALGEPPRGERPLAGEYLR